MKFQTKAMFLSFLLAVSGCDHKKGVDSSEKPQPRQIVTAQDNCWTNSLGMAFRPLSGTKVKFCIWETRVKDYAAFAKETNRQWLKPAFQQGLDHPAVNVSWSDAKAFCKWLTEREQKNGLLQPEQEYRLPTDLEWSTAVGLEPEPGNTPRERSMQVKNVYPWGTQWPPPADAGNFGYGVDGYDLTSPVGSFKTNQHGLYDLGGNVWEWCEDWYDVDQKYRLLRGASWFTSYRDYLLSSYRFWYIPDGSDFHIGFRAVMVSNASKMKNP